MRFAALKASKNKGVPGSELSPDERDLFRRRTAGTKPLAVDVIPPPPAKRPPKAHFTRRDERRVLAESLAEDLEDVESGNGDGLAFRHASVNRKTMRRLARGGFSVQGEIDLHGMTTAEARAALADFLEASRLRGHTCVRVVHGKGLRSGARGPVLKRKVDAWLRQWQGVLAYVSTRQVDGGTGAVYVLLKKRP